jgi:antitoxin component of MazEF toxin-antitoxin module
LVRNWPIRSPVGWLRVSDSAAQLNSMLGSPNVWHRPSDRGLPSRTDPSSEGWLEVIDRDTPCVYHRYMTKKLIRHGNSAALILDKALLDLLKVEMDTPLEVTTDGRNIIVSPQVNARAEATLLQALERINKKHGSVLAKLGK